MTTLKDRIAGERKRLREVRQLLSAATAQGAGDDQSWLSLYVAMVAYFDAAMERLHEQDIRMTSLLREKADLTTPEAQRAMAELAERLDGNQQHLRRFLDAGAALDRDGVAAIAEFESAASAYTTYITENMGHHAGSVDLAREAFTAEDWEHMALVSDEDAAREVALYDAVFAAKPLNLED